jgi:glyoxylase-like metal-dependent hydrolase (beta-lactamase superfamily II)/ferredoxin
VRHWAIGGNGPIISFVADPDRRHPGNAAGPWFVDDSCIDCDVSQQCAPWMFGRAGDQAVVVRQPQNDEERRDAARALLACPTGSIGVIGEKPKLDGLYPELVENDVFYSGFNSPKSYGAYSYFVRRASGNLLVDSPRFVKRLVSRFEELGGVSLVLLTHSDDVADAERYSEHFDAKVFIHAADREAAPFASDVLEGRDSVAIRPDLEVVPLPGHTRGSVGYLLERRYLFTGDSLAWSPTRGSLTAFRRQCWHSWSEQARSLERLAEFEFEWVLPGHGFRVQLPLTEMRRELSALVSWMRRPERP